MDAELLFHPGKWIKVNDSCQIISDLDLRFAEQQYDWKRKCHLAPLLAHLAFRPLGQVSYCHHFSSVIRPSTFHILIFSSETTGPIATNLWWNGPWVVPLLN
jgi:hypothetical protein